jgi:hypothetical protein
MLRIRISSFLTFDLRLTENRIFVPNIYYYITEMIDFQGVSYKQIRCCINDDVSEIWIYLLEFCAEVYIIKTLLVFSVTQL